MDIALGAIDNDTGDTLSAAIVTPPQPNHGSLGQIDQNTGNVTFTPAAGFSGNDSFTFKVIDSHQAESNVGTVSITVTPSVSTTPPTHQHQHQKIIHQKHRISRLRPRLINRWT